MGYKFGYKGARLTLAQMEKSDTWGRVDPVLRQRVVRMIDACPHDLGIGGGWRSTSEQEAMFRSRYVAHNAKPSGVKAVEWNGKWWTKKPGVADAAPPGRSFHEESTPDGYALAVDLLNTQPAIGWVVLHAAEFGLVHFADVNSEPWHVQPIEIPTARRLYDPAKHRLDGSTPISIPRQTSPREENDMTPQRAAKLVTNGSWWLGDGRSREWQGDDAHEAKLRVAAGVIDAKSAKLVYSWDAVSAVDEGFLDQYLGVAVDASG